jgi:hypothetical protein
MKISLASLLMIAGALLAPVRAARACGGGVVTTAEAATLGADAQRIFISVRGGMTDVITQIGVPSTTADYGVLIPVPSEPTLDATPVMSAELDVLFSATTPQVFASGGDDGGGCGCPVATGSDKGGGAGPPVGGDVQVSKPVAIGPVTAVTLTADTGAAISAWLADNGFAIPAGDQSIVDAYAGPGRYFIAVRRNDTAATGQATSIGLHFTLAGDERGLPLRFARIGAGATVGFTVLVVSDGAAAPSAPFTTLKITELDAAAVKSSGYAAALSAEIARRGNHAFVVEGVWSETEFQHSRITSLRPFIPPGSLLTRLSTLVPAEALDADVVLDQPLSGPVPRSIYVQRGDAPARNPKLAFGCALFALAAVASRRAQRRG